MGMGVRQVPDQRHILLKKVRVQPPQESGDGPRVLVQGTLEKLPLVLLR